MKTDYVVIRFEYQSDGEWFCISNERQTKIGSVRWYSKKKAWLYYANQDVKIGMPAFVVKDISKFMEQLRVPVSIAAAAAALTEDKE